MLSDRSSRAAAKRQFEFTPRQLGTKHHTFDCNLNQSLPDMVTKSGSSPSSGGKATHLSHIPGGRAVSTAQSCEFANNWRARPAVAFHSKGEEDEVEDLVPVVLLSILA